MSERQTTTDAPLPNELVPVIQRLLRLPTRAEQASQALQWVQAEIRYYSVSLGESSPNCSTTSWTRGRLDDVGASVVT